MYVCVWTSRVCSVVRVVLHLRIMCILTLFLFIDQVTDAGMEEIGTQCTQLTQLSLAECDNVQVRRVQDLGTMTQKIV